MTSHTSWQRSICKPGKARWSYLLLSLALLAAHKSTLHDSLCVKALDVTQRCRYNLSITQKQKMWRQSVSQCWKQVQPYWIASSRLSRLLTFSRLKFWLYAVVSDVDGYHLGKCDFRGAMECTIKLTITITSHHYCRRFCVSLRQNISPKLTVTAMFFFLT